MQAVDEMTEHGRWFSQTTLQKWASDEAYQAGDAPDEVITVERNVLLAAGITRISNLIIGTTTTPYGAAARVWVGDSSTAAAQAQTAMQAATNKVAQTVTSATLTGGTPNKMQFIAAFAPGVGEWGTGWQEWGVDNGAGAAEMLNRFVQNLGVKTGGTWTLTVTVGIA